jgi:hypothetical protein
VCCVQHLRSFGTVCVSGAPAVDTCGRARHIKTKYVVKTSQGLRGSPSCRNATVPPNRPGLRGIKIPELRWVDFPASTSPRRTTAPGPWPSGLAVLAAGPLFPISYGACRTRSREGRWEFTAARFPTLGPAERRYHDPFAVVPGAAGLPPGQPGMALDGKSTMVRASSPRT